MSVTGAIAARTGLSASASANARWARLRANTHKVKASPCIASCWPIASSGVTTLLVEQNAKLALEMCDRCYVMESGEITLTGPARDLLDNPQVRAAYLGE